MSDVLAKKLTERLGERARFAEPMSLHTTWGIGGPAWCLVEVLDQSEAAFVLRAAKREGMTVKPLGRGSNLLVSDRGWRGIMLKLSGELAAVDVRGAVLVGGGGASLAACVAAAESNGLAGLEWATGIPATLGGAVATNAGARGGDMAALTEELLLVMDDGIIISLPGGAVPSAYRSRRLPSGSVVLAASLSLTPDDPAAVAERGRLNRLKRRESQPRGVRTAGSVFKNPQGDFAGRLIEAAGLKGLTSGDARVSPVHANFIENTGRATAADVLALMSRVADEVRQASGISLEPEVEVVGVV